MSKIITYEGEEYILKSEVENIVTSRISKISESKRTALSQNESLKEELEKVKQQAQNIDGLHNQISILREQLTDSQSKYSRHSAIASHGITNPEVRDLFEYQYNKTMENLNKKDRVTMGEWLDGLKGEGAQIPHILQPFLTTSNNEIQPEQQAQNLNVSAAPIPNSNYGVQSTSDKNNSRDVIQKGTTDFEYYQKNRAKIRELYYAKKGRAI